MCLALSAKGIILLAHGSRLDEANSEVLGLAGRLAEKEGPEWYCGAAFLQGGSPDLDEAVKEAAAAGCGVVYVVPLFLTAGVHIRKDLPQMLARAGEANSGLELVQCRHLGCDPRLVHLIFERVAEKMPDLSPGKG